MGANPFIMDSKGNTQYADNFDFLSKLEYSASMKKSVYFTVNQFPGYVGDDPWYYTDGVFGSFDERIGHGGEGIVIGGTLSGAQVAYKFVPIQTESTQTARTIDDILASQLKIMRTWESVDGSCILMPIGHYR